MKKNDYSENKVASRLNFALKRREMTQSELADLTGINFSTISSYVSGRFEPEGVRNTALSFEAEGFISNQINSSDERN